MKIKQRQNGFTLVEVLVYVVVLTAIVGAMGYFVTQTYQLYRVTLESARADRVGVSLHTRLAREIRSGASIDGTESTFGVIDGILTLQTADQTVKQFSLSDDRIFYTENGGIPVALTPDTVTISELQFEQIITPVSQGVWYEVVVSYEGAGGVPTTHAYRGVAILRQSYE